MNPSFAGFSAHHVILRGSFALDHGDCVFRNGIDLQCTVRVYPEDDVESVPTSAPYWSPLAWCGHGGLQEGATRCRGRELAGSLSNVRSVEMAAPMGFVAPRVRRIQHGLMPTGMHDFGDTRPLYFFLSYARADSRDDPLLGQFFRDLRAEVRRHAGYPDPDTVGFLDLRSIQPGDAWSAQLGAALCRCRTFVAMCSPSFFVSENCGREWGIFESRLRGAATLGQTCPSALLPVIWTPLRRVPESLARLQYDHERFGKGYAESGLRYLMQLKRTHDEYQEFLLALAGRIVQLAEDSPLAPQSEIPPFHEVPNAFGMSTDPVSDPDQRDLLPLEERGPRWTGKNPRRLPRLDGP